MNIYLFMISLTNKISVDISMCLYYFRKLYICVFKKMFQRNVAIDRNILNSSDEIQGPNFFKTYLGKPLNK